MSAVTAALLHKERTGEGQFVEVPMLECVTSFLMVEHLYGATFEPKVGHAGATPAVSPERAALPANPADFIDVMHLGMVKVERL